MIFNSSIIIFEILIFFLVIKFFKNNTKNVQKLQNTHSYYAPPLAGVIVFLSFILQIILVDSNSFFNNHFFIFGSLVIIILSLINDYNENISPKLRLFSIITVSSLTIFSFETLPEINIPFIYEVTEEFIWLKKLLYIFALALLINGMNIIDGLNGLTAFTTISILASIILIIITFDLTRINEYYYLLFATLAFLFFNFPKGKIFLGDSGAYWLGYVVGVMVINLFNQIELQGVDTKLASIILFYPVFEVLFSFIRKLLKKKSPLYPDLHHIHLKTFHFLNNKNINNSNSLSTLLLMPVWLSPLLFIYLVLNYNLSILLALIALISIYLSYYVLIKN